MKLLDILDLGRAMESSHRQASEIESNTAESVNRLGNRTPYQRKAGHEKPAKSCYNCGFRRQSVPCKRRGPIIGGTKAAKP